MSDVQKQSLLKKEISFRRKPKAVASDDRSLMLDELERIKSLVTAATAEAHEPEPVAPEPIASTEPEPTPEPPAIEPDPEPGAETQALTTPFWKKELSLKRTPKAEKPPKAEKLPKPPKAEKAPKPPKAEKAPKAARVAESPELGSVGRDGVRARRVVLIGLLIALLAGASGILVDRWVDYVTNTDAPATVVTAGEG